ncbi:MAG: hypothetical protein QOD03_1396 [Verrucomicrobiota bacterium]|jgi:NAD(P)-dependent dehydrogenase (short-subunit alcohol dehydrogenase family)
MAKKKEALPHRFPPQVQKEKPGREFKMSPRPRVTLPEYRAGQPMEVTSCYVFLASTDSSYMSGQVLHPNSGEIING